MKALLSKRLVLITGKGGVGRSSVTAALAAVAQRHGKRVLVAETSDGGEDYSALAQLFGHTQLPRNVAEIAPGIRGTQLLTSVGVEQYLTSVLRIPALARTAASSEPIRRLLSAGPSFREMGMFFHLLTCLEEKLPNGKPANELVIVDMPATGHTLALMSLPETLLRLVSRGPVAETLRKGQAYLRDATLSGAYIVTLPEILPISEALELIDGLKNSASIVSGVLVNRVPKEIFSPEERAALTPYLREHSVYGAESFASILSAQRMVERLQQNTVVPHLTLPTFDKHGTELVEQLSLALDGQEFAR